MLGTFMNALAGTGKWKVREVYLHNKQKLQAGEIVVSVYDLDKLKQTGLPTGLRFGIAAEEESVICQCCEKEDLTEPQFVVKLLSLKCFCSDGWRVYILRRMNQTEASLPVIYRRAKNELGTAYHNLRSYPGDDFVRECYASQNVVDNCLNDTRIGQHWWTPLYYNVKELQTELARAVHESIGAKISLPKPPENLNVACLHFRHHGIMIEDGWVIHFARCRVPNQTNQVKLDSLETFCNITPYAEPGEACEYKNDVEYKRVIHRNRAVWLLFHSEEWGKYNLFTNNCEHFSRFCKVGRRESAQVRNGVAQAAITALTFLTPGGFTTKIVAALGSIVIFKKTIPR